MAEDIGHKLTDEELQKIEKKINKTYRSAYKELTDTVKQFFAEFEELDAERAALVEAGELTEYEYQQWRLARLARGDRYIAMRDKVAAYLTDVNAVTRDYINDTTAGIYALNRNYAAYTIEAVGADVDFTLWNERTVKRLIVENPQLMPNYSKARALDRGIDLAFGKKQIGAAITSSIIQGKPLAQIADDMQKRIVEMSRVSAVRAARTATTNAQNAGRQDAYKAAADAGVKLIREWVATLDGRTRDDHGEADGQRVGVNEPFTVGGEKLMFPADAKGRPRNVYNCRCTIKCIVAGHDRVRETYSEWLERKTADDGK